MNSTYALWHCDSYFPSISGRLSDRTKVHAKYTNKTKGLVLLAVGNRVVTIFPVTCLEMNNMYPRVDIRMNNMYTTVDTWIKDVYWNGVDNPYLWSAAGCTPDEARVNIALPEEHPDRFTYDALKTLVSLRTEWS